MTKTKKKTEQKNWLFPLLAIPLLGLAAVFGFTAAMLNHAGEYMSTADIAAHLQSGGGIYGPALSPRILPVKEALYAQTAPEIVAIGSARIDQLGADNFSSSFMNMSGVQTLEDVTDLCHRLFDKQAPKILFLALDDWWFLQGGTAAVTQRAPATEKPGAHDLFLLAGWYATGDLGFGDVKTILGDGSANIGINAMLHGDGFDRSGAYAYRSLMTSAAAAPDKSFAKSLDAVAHGRGTFGWSDNIDPAQWKKFTDLLDYLQQKNIKTYLWLPPLAPTVLDAMNANGKYGYIDGLRMKISETSAAYRMPLFDDHDLRFTDGADCEFIDGMHPGAIADKRALLDMALKDADLRAHLKLPEIGWAIAHFKGQASTQAGEADFLQLGCAKSAASH